ncbi:unnamed protein product [Prunus armeniaca]
MAISALKTIFNLYVILWTVAAVDKAFADPNKWTQMSILSTAGLGIFSSNRTIQDYAEKT